MKYLLVIILFGFHLAVYSQESEVINNTLNQLKKIDFDSVNTVVLGEERHSDGTIKYINENIIKYLVNEHNFEYLIIESDFYALYNLNKQNKINKTDLKNNIYSTWSCSTYFKKIFSLIENNKLKILGFDSRLKGQYSIKHLQKDLKKSIPGNSTDLIDTTLFFKLIDKLLNKEFDSNLSENDYQFMNHTLDNFLINIKDTNSFNYQKIINFKNYIIQIYKESNSVTDYVEHREYSMADNMLFLLNGILKDKKIIILGANLHVQPNITKISHHAKYNVGDIIKKTRKKSLFIIPYVYKYQQLNKQKVVWKKQKRIADFDKDVISALINSNEINVKTISKNKYLKTYQGCYLLYVKKSYINKKSDCN